MNSKAVYDRLPTYLNGELHPSEREEFEAYMATDPVLQETVARMQRIDALLCGQPWLVPSPDFTDRVMRRVALERPAPVSVQLRARARTVNWGEVGTITIPALVMFAVLLPFIRSIGDAGMGLLRDIGFWLGSMTGIPFFAAYPIFLLAIAAPLFAGAVASCALTGKCRITRTLTS